MPLPEEWLDAFPLLARLQPPAAALFERAARPVDVAPGTVLFQPGAPCDRYLMVLEGTVRVQMVSQGGREIVLYRVGKGETCILTMSCLVTGQGYSAEGIAETPMRALTLPLERFHALLSDSPEFRRFTFSSYGARLTDLILLIEEVAFRRIDIRLAQFLIARQGDGRLLATHQEIAVELGTAREVISRQLKEFERRGWVRLARGRIELADAARLAALAKKNGA